MSEIRDVHESIDQQRELSPDCEAEYHRDRRWADFENACLEFADVEPDGWAAVLRAVSRAMKYQRELPYGH